MIPPASGDPCYKRAKHALYSSVLEKSTATTRSLALAMAITGLAEPQVIAHGGGFDSQGMSHQQQDG